MRVFHGFDALPAFHRPAAAVGSFDGVHGGHKSLLGRVMAEAQASGGESIVLTFDPHPRVTLGDADGLRLLTSFEEKAWLLEREGIDNLIVIPFDRAFSRLAPDVFVRDYLIGKVGVETLVVGYNHRFGYGKEGDYDFLDRLHRQCGFRVVRVSEYNTDAEKVSSTMLRGLVERGEMEHAARMMSHPYVLIGEAKEGMVRIAEPLKLLPPPGVYRVCVNGQDAWLVVEAEGQMRIGVMPAVSEETGYDRWGSALGTSVCEDVRGSVSETMQSGTVVYVKTQPTQEKPEPKTEERTNQSAGVAEKCEKVFAAREWGGIRNVNGSEAARTQARADGKSPVEVLGQENDAGRPDGLEIRGEHDQRKDTKRPDSGSLEGKILITF